MQHMYVKSYKEYAYLMKMEMNWSLGFMLSEKYSNYLSTFLP